MDIAKEFILSATQTFEANKQLAERAIAQVTDDQLHATVDKYDNPIAVIMKHIAGNLASRWSNFLTTDGEKASRNRDDEFVDTLHTRDEIMDHWEHGWSCLFNTLNNLTPEDFNKTVFIRGEPHSIPLALERSLSHTCFHIGQIVQLAHIQSADNWKTLSIPKGQSEKFNKENWGEHS